MKKLLLYIAVPLVIFGCSKAAVEPNPSDQVVGTYKTTTYFATAGGSGIALDLTDASVSSGLTITFSVVKKTINTATVIEKDVSKDSTGKAVTDTYTYDIDVKKDATVSTQYNFTDSASGISRGMVESGNMTFLNQYNTKNGSGVAITVKETFIAKKSS